jgi:hypothetical protein
VFAPKDKIGDWLEMYTKVMELNYWGSTTCKKATFDEAAADLGRGGRARRPGRCSRCKPKELVFALGVSGYPNVPQIPGAETFLGDQHHSSKHPGPEAYQGKKVRGAGLQQLGARHLRRAVGARRRRDHGAAQLHAHRAVGFADGAGARAGCTPSRR